MKTYVLIISQEFPRTHNRAGHGTLFIKAISDRTKIHTIRANYPLWKKRFEEIELGNACLSVRVWSGKPYRSKQTEVFRFTREDGIGIQKLSNHLREPFTDTNYKQIANNDGLTLAEFNEWFDDYKLYEPMAIIHFTKFRYKQK